VCSHCFVVVVASKKYNRYNYRKSSLIFSSKTGARNEKRERRTNAFIVKISGGFGLCDKFLCDPQKQEVRSTNTKMKYHQYDGKSK
jgi:hypothetical protein